MSASLIGQILVNGLFSGASYVLMAIGFTLIFGILRLVNFAHGEFYMVGAFTVYVATVHLHLPFILALGAAIAVALAIGVISEQILFKPLYGLELQGMIMALALGIALQSIALLIFGPREVSAPRLMTGSWLLGEVYIPKDRALVTCASILILAVFYWFMKRTQVGLAIHAVAQDAKTAALMGIPIRRMQMIAFCVGTALAALAGALMATIYDIGPYMGEIPMLKAFIVVIIGGLGSVAGAAIGGFLLGFVESSFATFYSPSIAVLLSFVCVLVFLVFKPTGLLGKA